MPVERNIANEPIHIICNQHRVKKIRYNRLVRIKNGDMIIFLYDMSSYLRRHRSNLNIYNTPVQLTSNDHSAPITYAIMSVSFMHCTL